MTDLLRDLPHFPVRHYANLIPALEKHQVTTTDLLTLDVADICKRTQLPLLDLKRLCKAVLEALHADLGVLGGATERKDLLSPKAAANGDGSDGVDSKPESNQQHQPPPRSLSPAPQPGLQWSTISTLDPALDATLNGGIPSGYITEIAGEAGAGKTQFLLSLLLAVQLPPPHGTGRRALYISTEAPLSTRRLTQILTHNPLFASLPCTTPKPTLDNVISTTTPDLESQEHILTYQVPVEVERRNIGLIVLDSVAANYRAEFDRGKGGGSDTGPGSASNKAASRSSNMGARSTELVRLGMMLRDLARKHHLAVVVSNQVADRFRSSVVGSPLSSSLSKSQQQSQPPSSARTAERNLVTTPAVQRARAGYNTVDDSPLAARGQNSLPPLPPIEPTSSVPEGLLPQSSMSLANDDTKEVRSASAHEEDPEEEPPTRPPPPPPPDEVDPHFLVPAPPALLFDHQQRWFSGWGDDPTQRFLKTPSLGLVWTTQLACRIVLFKAPRYGRSRYAGDEDDAGGHAIIKTWRRWMKVVFAPHCPGAGPGLERASEFEINMGGIKSVVRDRKG
ncbi:P-loop containing nucleoside triphosphate hydrolase protein [Coniella lustricola]|uniref:P-loop containing nucleoside triphosphate hydrolase protein n=1 Tax=Coniella lustricola TaxID=2025994 RepID=A0A2T3A973_9PEZI|nr:P-loop containing nucleoside triphosphate hydrolase protein [Coniella lustricola]